MKCSPCGSRKIDARPELCPGGFTAMRGHERMLVPLSDRAA
jgi:hypothetical protein